MAREDEKSQKQNASPPSPPQASKTHQKEKSNTEDTENPDVLNKVQFADPEMIASADSGIESESPETSPVEKNKPRRSILKPARRAQRVRVKGSRRIAHLFPTQQQQDRLEMYGYSVLVDVCIQNLKIRALFDTGATNTVISPRALALLHSPPECLPYDRSYGGASPDIKIPSQGVVQLPFRIGDQLYQYRAVVADIDGPLIIGADFMMEHEMQLRFTRKGGSVKDSVNNTTFKLHIEKRHMAQWVKTRITECIQPGQEKMVTARMVNCHHRARPPPGEGGMLEPVTSLRAKGALVPYVYMNAHTDTPITVYNTGDEPLWLDAGTILGCWTPAKILSRISQDQDQDEDAVANPDQFDVTLPKEDQGYESDDSDVYESETEDSDTDSLPSSTESEPDESDDELQSEARTHFCKKQYADPPSHLEDLVQRSDLVSKKQKAQLMNLLQSYQDVMVDPRSPLGRTPLVEHKIDTGDAMPIRQAMRPPAKSLAGASEAEIQKMLDQGLIRPSDSPWASPVVLVRKKDGTIRFCVDYRRLNEVTRKDAYPLPRIDACFDCLGRSTWFCTLDLRSGYWQVPVQPEDVEKTAFITPQGLYEYLVMPFGLTNAPATFERLMEKVLKGLQWKQCLVYIDDIIVFGSTFTETLDHLKQVFQRLRQAKLTCKPRKCELFRKKVAFLGHIVSKDGLECDPKKIEAVSNWPVPRTAKDIRSFLGLAGYYRRFIKNFAEYSAPLTELTKSNVPFEWTKRQQNSFDALKSCLCNPPVLSYPTDEDMYILDTDASNHGIGAVLSQVQGPHQEERVISYASKTLQGAQKTYCTTKKELFAMVYFVKHFRHYLLGRRFLVRTDHASLLWLLNFRNPEGILARWLMTLSSYMPFDYITHRAGKDHGNADAMSRIPLEEPIAHKRCPKTYVGCPSCYPGAVTIDMSPGERDLTAQIATAQANLVRSKKNSRTRKNTKRVTINTEDPVDNEEASVGCECEESMRNTSTEVPSKETPSSRDGTTPLTRANFTSWTFGWSSKYLRQVQRDDLEIRTVLTRKQHHATAPPPDLRRRESHELKTYWSQWDTLTVIDGLLYRRYRIRPEADSVLQLIVPRRLRPAILTYAHDVPQAAHRGEHGTFGTVRSRFYWPTYRKDVKLHVRACEKCQRSKPRDPGRAPLQQVAAGEPMECCAMDLLGPFDPATDAGNRYVLVIGDVFSKWIEAYAIPNKEAVTVAKKLTDFFCRFGIPQRLHSDRGKEFHNQVIDEVSRLLHIQPTFTTAYRPQSNGMIERFNRTLIKMLKTFIDDFVNPTTWDTLLPMLTSAYRATEHASTKCTPNLLFMGREVHLPVDVLAGAPPRQRTFYNAASYGQWLSRSLSAAHKYARETLGKAAVRQKRGYDQRHKTRKWTPTLGEWVYLYYPPYSRYKLGSPWIGPYVVVGQGKARTWLIQAAPDKPVRVAHEDNLKSVQGRLQLQDNWIRQQQRHHAPDVNPEEDDAYLSPPNSDDETSEDEQSQPVKPRLPDVPKPTSITPPALKDERKPPSKKARPEKPSTEPKRRKSRSPTPDHPKHPMRTRSSSPENEKPQKEMPRSTSEDLQTPMDPPADVQPQLNQPSSGPTPDPPTDFPEKSEAVPKPQLPTDPTSLPDDIEPPEDINPNHIESPDTKFENAPDEAVKEEIKVEIPDLLEKPSIAVPEKEEFESPPEAPPSLEESTSPEKPHPDEQSPPEPPPGADESDAEEFVDAPEEPFSPEPPPVPTPVQSPSPPEPPPLRRSTRVRRAPKKYDPCSSDEEDDEDDPSADVITPVDEDPPPTRQLATLIRFHHDLEPD